MDKIFRILRYDWPLHLVLLLTNTLPDNVLFMRLRGFLLRPFFKKCGHNFRVARGIIGRALRFIKDFPGIYQLYRWQTERSFVLGKLTSENVFKQIYDDNKWNNDESVSGIGSMRVHTKLLIEQLPVFCRKENLI